MDRQGQDRQGWVERPLAARAVGFVAYAIPFVGSVIAAVLLSSALPPAASIAWGVVRWVAIAAVSTLVLLAVERQTRRLLPLRALLGLTLAFPDRAPSRFKIAIRTGTTNQLRERLAEARDGKLGDTPSEAARRLLELVGMLSLHDRQTRGHSERVRAYTHLIAEEMGFSGQELDRLRWAGLLHDVGKLAIAEEILNKPGKLTADEYEIVKTHPMEGKRLVAPLADWLGDAVRAVWEHHERWDGRGYPAGLAGTEISQAARIVAVADTYDVMTSVRSYKAASSAAEARRELARCAGTQFDPECVRAFLAVSVSRVRGTMGPLSILAQLSLLPQSIAAQAGPALATTAVVTAGAAAGTVGIAAGPIAPAAADGGIPGIAESAIDYEAFEWLAPPTTAIIVLTTPSVAPSPVTVDAPVSPTPPTSSTPEPDPDPDAAAGTTPPDVPAAPTTVATTVPGGSVPASVPPATPPTTGPDDDPPESSPPTTDAPEVAATVPPTATPTTPPTTEPPPTSPPPTTEPPPLPITGEFYLASSGPGPVRSSPELPLTMAEPTEFWLYNYDTDRDNDDGLVIEADEDGVSSTDPESVQAFRYPIDGLLDGDAKVKLYVAPEDFDGHDVVVEASLSVCRAGSDRCEELARASKNVNKGRYFKSLTLPLGAVRAMLAPGDVLELRVAALVESESDMWLAYGTTNFPSVLVIDD